MSNCVKSPRNAFVPAALVRNSANPSSTAARVSGCPVGAVELRHGHVERVFVISAFGSSLTAHNFADFINQPVVVGRRRRQRAGQHARACS